MIMGVYNRDHIRRIMQMRVWCYSCSLTAVCQLPASGVPDVAASETGPWPGGGVS